ncbi:MAG: flagellar basal body P-ring protein FlgI [Hydrocarboniphaga sp.]|uniref:flagellar basal body P-ring protein FlgI n=1 Tax=Hydrocarboniphaga sp. TaxID=2033016 RepID=UPI00260D4F6C|nr:flagellar basal body P-ring protein FlgI [Hydrocarboniphaga sp.]MDB5967589.1 flagellar basal body P-ring protein FlgI [Hydrocarboniphaga sp.]
MKTFSIGIALAISLSFAAPVRAERVKDLASVQGVRTNALVGYGLVVGLDGSGDQTTQAPFTVQSLKSMLAQLGVTVPANVNPQLKNVAAVAIHAELPPFAKPGQMIDITVASIGNSGSLRGGSLLMAPLKGADGQIYAIAQGNVIVGGLGVSGKDGSRVTVNIPSAGRIPGGASVERSVPSAFDAGGDLLLNLHTADFTTATRLAQGINAALKSQVARAIDSVTVAVQAPQDSNQRVMFMAELESIDVTPGEAPARVIINSRTGTVVISSKVEVMPAAVAHGSLSVTITERPQVSQPLPFSKGETAVVPQSSIEVTQSGGQMFKFPAGVDLDEIVRAVNQIGASPGDLVAILEALKQAGALRAELVVI